MTVRDLLAALAEYPPEWEVTLRYETWADAPISKVFAEEQAGEMHVILEEESL